ncbi:hypothetical protein [Marisediminicola sp. LYQ134]|uniref:DUF7882 family protein n=1 Tax=unclassified Marisediminicola TaxID=2618316 RepID=UPI0039839BC0
MNMGKLIYGPQGSEITIDDNTLSHVKAVVIAKLRRRENFAFSWHGDDSSEYGRTTIWISHSIPLQFLFDDAAQPELNRRWVELLVKSADSPAGLHLLPEPAAAEPATV